MQPTEEVTIPESAVYESWKASVLRMETSTNTCAAADYIAALDNAMKEQLAGHPVPSTISAFPPKKVKFVVDPTGKFRFDIVETDEYVTSRRLADVILHFGTDTNEVGSGVGGPIQAQPGHYYRASSLTKDPWPGSKVTVHGRTFVWTEIGPAVRFWKEEV